MISKQLVDKAKHKAQGAQALYTKGESVEISFENDNLKSVHSSQSTGLNLKLIKDGKVGLSSTTETREMDGLLNRALEIAEFGNIAHFQFPASKKTPDVKVFDDSIFKLTKKNMIEIGKEMIARIKEYNPDILVDAGISKGQSVVKFANSSGNSHSSETTAFSIGVNGQLIRGTDILGAGHGCTWKKRDIDHMEIAKKVIQLFKMAEKTADVKSGTMPVIFTPAGVNVLVLALRLGFNGKNVFFGASPLAGRLGEIIADEKFSLIDNPLLDYAANSSKYDLEGVPHQTTPLIEKGIIKNFLYDLDTAGRAGRGSTGNAPECTSTNFVIPPGETPYKEILKNTKKGILVHSVLGLGQGNPVSGEFSVNVHLGYKIENGEIIGRVKNVMLAGNTYDALKNIIAIGDKAEWAGGALLTPSIQVGSLSVVAR